MTKRAKELMQELKTTREELGTRGVSKHNDCRYGHTRLALKLKEALILKLKDFLDKV